MKAAAPALVLALALALPTPAHAARVQHAREGSLRATYTFPDTAKRGSLAHGRLRIWRRGRRIINRVADYYGLSPPRVLFIRQLDGTGPPEVLLHLYSGGAHCCSETWIFTGAHRALKRWGHGGAPPLRDADKDRKPEFHGVDTGFAYWFSSFGDSRFPAKVWSYARGAVHDVTPSFPAEVETDMAQHYAAYESARAMGQAASVRATLAAYAADAYSLGRGAEAMAVVQAAVIAGETGTRKSESDPLWESDYLGTLQRLLHARGYAP